MKISAIAKARKVSGIPQCKAAESLGMSLPTYCKREQSPETFSVAELSRLAAILDEDGKTLVRRYIAEVV